MMPLLVQKSRGTKFQRRLQRLTTVDSPECALENYLDSMVPLSERSMQPILLPIPCPYRKLANRDLQSLNL